MENEMHIFECWIDWKYRGIIHTNKVSYLAENYQEFINIIKRDYGFADECIIYHIYHIIYLNSDVINIKMESKNDSYYDKKYDLP